MRVSLAPVTPPLAPSLSSPVGEFCLTNKPSIATLGRGRRRRTRGNERTNTIDRDTRMKKIRKVARFEGLALGLNYATRDLRVNRSAVLFYRLPRMFSASRARSTPPQSIGCAALLSSSCPARDATQHLHLLCAPRLFRRVGRHGGAIE